MNATHSRLSCEEKIFFINNPLLWEWTEKSSNFNQGVSHYCVTSTFSLPNKIKSNLCKTRWRKKEIFDCPFENPTLKSVKWRFSETTTAFVKTSYMEQFQNHHWLQLKNTKLPSRYSASFSCHCLECWKVNNAIEEKAEQVDFYSQVSHKRCLATRWTPVIASWHWHSSPTNRAIFFHQQSGNDLTTSKHLIAFPLFCQRLQFWADVKLEISSYLSTKLSINLRNRLDSNKISVSLLR